MKKPRVTFYKDAAGKWRWRARARNGKIVADCAEGDGYERRQDAETGATIAAALLWAWANP